MLNLIILGFIFNNLFFSKFYYSNIYYLHIKYTSIYKNNFKYKTLVYLYYWLLDYSNITYIVVQIILRSKFSDFIFFILDIVDTNIIQKIIIFIDSIFKCINIVK